MIKSPTDYMIIGNIPALKEACLAVDKSRNEIDGVKANQILMAGMETAKRILNAELDHYLGSGRRIGITVSGSNVGETCPIYNFL